MDERVRVDIPWHSIIRVLLAGILVWLWFQLYYLALIMAAATMLAVALNPGVERLQRFGVPRWLGAIAISVILVGTIGAFIWATWASMSDQANLIADEVEHFVQHTMMSAPRWMRDAMQGAAGSDPASAMARYAVPLARSASAAI